MHNLRRQRTRFVVLLLFLFGTGAYSWAAPVYWNTGTGNWSDGSAWLGGEPGPSDIAYIGYSGIGVKDGTATVTESGETCDYLYLGYGWPDDGTLEINSGAVSTNRTFVGYGGDGTVWHTGGTHTVATYLTVGNESSGFGIYELSGPSETELTTKSTAIGGFGGGSFHQTGGTHHVNSELFVWGISSWNTATYSLEGGTISGPYMYLTGAGTTTLTINGGTASPGSLFVAGSGTPEVVLLDGQLTPGSTWLGDLVKYSTRDPASFTQSGGLHSPSTLYVGEGASSVYDLSNGTLAAYSEYIGGRFTKGVGTFLQSGGLHVVTVLEMGVLSTSSAEYVLSGGVLDVRTLFLGDGAAFSFTGGSLVWGGLGEGPRDLADLDAIGIDYSGWSEVMPLGAISYNASTGETTFAATPEPASCVLALAALGFGGFYARRRRKQARRSSED